VVRSAAALILLTGVAAWLCGCAELQTNERPGDPSDIGFGGAEVVSINPASPTEAPTPHGFISFCLRFPDQCNATPSSPQFEMTLERWALLRRTNAFVNSTIEPESDLEHYGVAEYWTLPVDGIGDCEDYVLVKRRLLGAAGLPQDALRIAIVQTNQGARHAVLIVSTDTGDYVLDSMRDQILRWSETAYTWIEEQDPAHPLQWVALPGLQIERAETATAANTSTILSTQ
jgi:predicted transglutaminase-like cysteine proteinase